MSTHGIRRRVAAPALAWRGTKHRGLACRGVAYCAAILFWAFITAGGERGVCAAEATPSADASSQAGGFLQQVRPLLAQRCFTCHGALRQQGNLRLDTAAAAKRGGDSGPAIVPGNSGESLLIQAVRGTAGFRMPPEGEGSALTEAEISRLTTWIDAGARAPADEQPEPDPREHWAFRPITRPAAPQGDHGEENASPVDAFVAAAWAREGLVPSSPATRPVWLRRVTLDLIGLPPTSEELAAYLADDQPGAEERVVDRLLASPQYGERWGRHWMDVWRYSDWYGRRSVPDVMNSYAMIWRWRDWIVRSLNADRGYDRMLQEMLAGDELAPEDAEALSATGFIVRNWFKWNYNQWKRDLVEHTSKAFLGLTMNCAHCHDHKYDPISQTEYFQMRACFEPLELRQDRMPGEADPGPFRKYVYTESYGPITSGMIRVFDEVLDAPTYMYAGGDERNRIADRSPAVPGVPAVLGGAFQVSEVQLPVRAWYPGRKEFVEDAELAAARAALLERETALAAAVGALSALEARLAATASVSPATEAAGAAGAAGTAGSTAVSVSSGGATSPELALAVAMREVAQAGVLTGRFQIEALEARIAADRAHYADDEENAVDDAVWRPLARAAARQERLAALAAARQKQTEVDLRLQTARAQPVQDAEQQNKALAALEAERMQADEGVKRAWTSLAEESDQYTPLSPVYPARSTGRRLALARWITAKENPLTARVAANYLWMWHFGRPLVETVYNFGRGGKTPSHPELLDWLASELMSHDWRMKPLHRAIVLSRAYRLASSVGETTQQNLSRDPDNRWLWRYPRGRMEAEVVRDSILYVTGGLDLTLGGPEIDAAEGLRSQRRSMYFAQHGEGKMQLLELFDGVNVCDSYRRTTSVMPQQALALVNSELTLRQSRLGARRLAAMIGEMAPGTARDAQAVQSAFRQVLCREPSPEELARSLEFLARQRALFAAAGEPALAPPPAATPPDQPAPAPAEGDLPATDPELRSLENLVHVLLNHHDFVTIH